MTEQGQQRKLGVSLTQVIAGVLASVSAAVVASYFGIAGTLIGAAATSAVIIVGGALYQRTIERTQGRLVRIWRDPRTGAVTRKVVTESPRAAGRGRMRWGPVLGGLTAVLGLTFGAVTAVELVAQQPLAALVQQESPPAGQTTLGAAVRGAVDEVTIPPPAPSTEPNGPAVGTASPTREAKPTTEVEPTPSATAEAERTPTPAWRTAVPTAVTPTAVPATVTPTAAPVTAVPTAAPTQSAPSATPRQGTPTPP